MFEDERFGTILTAAGCVVLILVMVWNLIRVNTGTAEYRAAYDQNELTIAELEGTLEGIETVTEETVVKNVDLNSARTDGQAVAKIQESYWQIATTDMDERGEQLTAVAEQMDAYLASSDTNYRTPWFSYDSSWRAVDSFSWTFTTTYSFQGSLVPVLWVCHNSTGQLVAYCTGTYASGDGTFYDLKVTVTTLGSQYAEAYTGQALADPESSVFPSEDEEAVIEDTEDITEDSVDVLDEDVSADIVDEGGEPDDET